MTSNNRISWGAVLCTAVLALFVLTAAAAAANGPARVSMETTAAQKINLTVGKSIIVESRESITRVSISAPDIADALVLTPYQIYVTGKSAGVTNMTVWRAGSGTFSAVFDIEVNADIARLKEKIYQVMPGEQNILVTASGDNITLAGTVSSAAVLSQALALAAAYAPRDAEGKPKLLNLLEVGGVQQVLLEVRVSEMSRSLMKRIGFNFTYLTESGRQFGISLLDNLVRLPSSGAFPTDPLTISDNINLIFRFLGGGSTWTVFIDALKDQGLLKVLAEPSLITLSGKSADFLAGGEYPIPVPQASFGGNVITIEYKPFGVGLKFNPTVLSSGKISMQVAPEVSDLDFSNAVTLQGYVVPALTTRRVSTVVELADGQSFAIAGLLRENVREIVRKFPLLGDIPVLGALFRSSSFQKNDTELVIVVTAHLVKPLDTSKQTLPTDQFIEPNDFEFYLMGELEGRGERKQPQAASPSASLINRGAGLEGTFGHIVQ